MTDDDEALARDARDEVIDVGEVIEEVVVAARADPVAVAMTAQIGRDDVAVLREPLADLEPAVAEIEEAVQQQERRVAGRIPIENVVREAR